MSITLFVMFFIWGFFGVTAFDNLWLAAFQILWPALMSVVASLEI